MSAIVRKAQRADLKPLSELARETYAGAFGHSLDPSDLAAHLESNLSQACFDEYLDDDLVLVAEFENRLVGFIHIGSAWPENYANDVSPGDAELRRVYVLSGFQGQGIGRQLIDAAFREPVFRSAKSIYLDVWEDNQGALKLYKSYGFKVTGKRAFEVKSKAETGFDLIMVRRGTR